MTVRWVEGAVNECLEFVQQKMWKYICLPRSERRALNKRGLEQSSVTRGTWKTWDLFPNIIHLKKRTGTSRAG